jgi:hypothetical protein
VWPPLFRSMCVPYLLVHALPLGLDAP